MTGAPIGNHNRKKVDWALRVWAMMKPGEWYDVHEAYRLMLKLPYSLRYAPKGKHALSRIMGGSKYFDKDFQRRIQPLNTRQGYGPVNGVRVYRRKALW